MEKDLEIEIIMAVEDVDISNFDIGSFGSMCEKNINATDLNELFNRSSGVLSKRKVLCEALGIGESTLSGWLKEDRIPRMAKLIIGIVLLSEAKSSLSEHNQWQLEEIAYGPRIVQDGDTFLVVNFEKTKWSRETAKTRHIGKVLAQGIPDQESAEKLISYQKLQNTLTYAAEALASFANEDSPDFDSAYHSYVMNEIGGQVRDLFPEEKGNELFGKRIPRTFAEDTSQTDQPDKSDDK